VKVFLCLKALSAGGRLISLPPAARTSVPLCGQQAMKQ